MTVGYDLSAAMQYNAQDFSKDDIQEVLAEWEGKNDEEDWRWIVLLKDGRFMYMRG